MSKGTKRYSSTQERRIAASTGGQVQPASGALNVGSLKSDVKTTQSREWKLLISGKTTMCDSHQAGVRNKTIKKDWLDIVEQEAREGGYDLSVLAFSFDNRNDYYVMKDLDFNIMYQALLDYEQITAQMREQIAALKKQINLN